MAKIEFIINGKQTPVEDFYMRFNNKEDGDEYEYGTLVYFITEGTKRYCVRQRIYRDENGNVCSTDKEGETSVYVDQSTVMVIDRIIEADENSEPEEKDDGE